MSIDALDTNKIFNLITYIRQILKLKSPLYISILFVDSLVSPTVELLLNTKERTFSVIQARPLVALELVNSISPLIKFTRYVSGIYLVLAYLFTNYVLLRLIRKTKQVSVFFTCVPFLRIKFYTYTKISHVSYTMFVNKKK